MKSMDAGGSTLTPQLFIQVYREVKKFSPPRFLTLRLHSDRYKELYKLADIPESIQLGPTPGPMGRQIIRVACIRPPAGVGDGIAVVQDDETDPSKLVFEIHGIAEFVVENLAHDTPTQSSDSTSQPQG